MKAIVTICSKDKNHTSGVLSAYLRYTSPRIAKVKEIADKAKHPFLILSGKYGLIDSYEKIKDYDHLLTQGEVAEMSQIASEQARKLGVTSIDFYAKPNIAGWASYYKVIESVARELNIQLKVLLF